MKKFLDTHNAHTVVVITALICLLLFVGIGIVCFAKSNSTPAEAAPNAVTTVPFATTAPPNTEIEFETAAEETEISKYAETSEELIEAVLNAFGAHDTETFNTYAFKTKKYGTVYEKFCRKVSDTVDYKADRTCEDFEVYAMSSDSWHTFAAFLKEDSDVEITISTEFDYEKEMYCIVNIDVCTISYKKATDEPHTMLDFDEIKED